MTQLIYYCNTYDKVYFSIGRVDNSVEHLDDQDNLWKSLSMKKKDLKSKHMELRERLAQLERKSKGPGTRGEREFKDQRVYHLWAIAQKSNMTNEELASLKVSKSLYRISPTLVLSIETQHVGFPTRSDTNLAVKLQKMARGLKFQV